MVDRSITSYLKRLATSVLLLGPRQVGKSTLVQSLHPDRILNFADEETYLQHAKDPGLIKREVAAFTKPSLIVLDEIQRLPRILNTIQAILDHDKRHRFILTGSSARKLKRGQANLLPGRIVVQHLDPLNFWELGSSLDLERVLQVGSLPGIYLNPKDGGDILGSYASVYLREEIQQEAVAKDIGSYARFLDIAAQSSGEWINYSKIASDTEIPKETIRRFFTILEDTLVAFRIPSFKPHRSARRVSQRDRFVFFDVGVRNALLGLHTVPIGGVEKGRLFEQWVILQCLYFAHSHRKDWQFSSYRTHSGAEVDLVIDTGKRLLAVECKLSRGVTEVDFRGLRSFASVAGRPVEKIVVYTGKTQQKFSSNEIALPYENFFYESIGSI